jgi:Flp pilus assembly protein TadD
MLEAVLASADTRDVGEARRLRGEILSDLGDATDALSDLERAPGPSTPSASAARAVTLARLGRFADAERGIEQALEAGRDSGPVLLRAAQIHALRGDPVNAAHFARQAKNAGGIPLTQHQRRQADELQEQRGVTSDAT